MRKLIFNYVQTHKSEILGEWINRMKQEADERAVQTMSAQMFTKTSSEFIELLVSNFTETEEEFQSKVTEFAEKIVRLGWPLTVITLGLRIFDHIITDGMQEEELIDRHNFMDFSSEFERWMFPLYNTIIDAYAYTWERTVSLQKIALQELSAPLIPVFEKISVMPLVGTIDTERAKQIMENLLDGVVKHRAEVVLIDITGVPVVDTMVAHHIIQAADAVRLVGAKCMIVGIRPEIAQTIVTLGINLDQVLTTSTLKKGIEKALEMTERKIIEVEEER
ncbi:RsbT co-antagonist protein RsbRA [Pseudobacillus badius]|uniref:RsbT co-antagonist protein RsbRA n=1 Tax=Bacillus badius TaxID=1455 RepID=UPI0007B079C2|nr:RsbT co-antagonist protein RsbRA [Bacillus badius]KZO00417.1 RsbR protein [Bacillus badius]OCS86643.1 RsbR protein [Bacillus badius]OVE51657.1 RsbR protein [Bacillus badius]TDW02902.1 rsbT co-antagonist protein RsbR [Bacillus badius]GLY11793.1 modulator protein RsbR [Bacillus badius]